MENRNELLDGWVGQRVFVMHLVGPTPSDDYLREIVQNPAKRVFNELLQTRFGLYEFVAYDQFGITLATIEEDALRFFVPWGAVLQIYGSQQEDAPA
jgi:hypothetical protein